MPRCQSRASCTGVTEAWGRGCWVSRHLASAPGGPHAHRPQGLWGSPGSARPAGLHRAAGPSWLCSGRAAQPRAELCHLPVERGHHAPALPSPRKGHPHWSSHKQAPTLSCASIWAPHAMRCSRHSQCPVRTATCKGVLQIWGCAAVPVALHGEAHTHAHAQGLGQCQLRAARCPPDGPHPAARPHLVPGVDLGSLVKQLL